MKLWQKNTIESILKNYKKKTKKSLGQNYLLDHNILLKITKIINEYPSHTVVEIGSGLGGLTQAILEETPNPLISIEIDSVSFSIVKDIFFSQNNFPDAWKNRLRLFNQDIRKFDLEEYAEPPHLPPYLFVGNLPYNIATSIIIGLLESYKKRTCGIFMVQKEIANRLVSKVGDPDYSFISVILAAWVQIKKVAHIPPTSFYPPPKIDSSLIYIFSHSENIFDSPEHYLVFKTIAKAAFQHRRKKIFNSIKLALGKPHLSVFNQEPLNIDKIDAIITDYKSLRAEELTLHDYINISREFLITK